MRKFLIVGCGGSGDATLSYMMDSLRSELALHGVDKIPEGWQFVEVDVPVAPVRSAPGLGSIREQGGTYVGTGVTGVGYSVLDNGVTQTLGNKGALGGIATWAPRVPEEVIVAISAGAGQYRAVGRMIALSKAKIIEEALRSAWSRLSSVEAISELAALKVPGIGEFEPEAAPLVIVVSSMAGGAGASMALDVCRILTQIPGLNPSLMGIFMVSADIFDQLPEAARSGVRANSLAMLGEIVATQAGAARKHDVDVLADFGVQNGSGERIPFQRVFPVGRYVGAQRTQFGDGSPQAVYRGLGHGLAALMMSGSATEEYERYDLANTGSPTGDRSYLGWGELWDPLPWGSFGYASLSLGRERYREYSAQRIARTTVERLLHGHEQAGNSSSGSEQVARLLSSQWNRILQQIGLPAGNGGIVAPAEMFDWFVNSAFPKAEVDATARSLVDAQLAGNLPSPAGLQIAQWLPGVRQRLAERRSAFAAGVGQAAHQWAYNWQRDLSDRIVLVVEQAVSDFGIAYASALIERLEAHLGNTVIRGLNELSVRGPQDVSALPHGFENKVSGMKGLVANGQDVLEQLVSGFRGVFRDSLYAQAAGIAERVLSSSAVGFLAPLKSALREAQTVLEREEGGTAQHIGLAHLATDLFHSWPSDADLAVPTRFDVANNQVLLTRSSDFPAQYVADLIEAVQVREGDDAGFESARSTAVGQVISGIWQTSGGTQPPAGLISRTAPWRSAVFAANPFTNEVQVPSEARFVLHTTPGELVARARLFVSRPSESFDRFCSLTLRQFVLGENIEPSEAAIRRSDIVAKFREALSLARPLSSVNSTAVRAIHNTEMQYRYKFSELPFALIPGVEDTIVAAVTSDPSIDESSLSILTKAMSSNDGVTKVDIFGSYPNYSPLVFDSVLEPVARQWASTPEMGRGDFWRWRRARPLTAALPMGDSERRAMILGWFVGQIVGQVRIPDISNMKPVAIWDTESAGWVEFPDPLLTSPSEFRATFDWLPAVLESVLIAIARSNEPPVLESLRPYRLLRSLFDSTSATPATGVFEPRAKTTLAKWLESGKTESGLATRVPGIVDGQSIAERAELAKKWLSVVNTLAGRDFVGAGDGGAPGGGSFSSISSRAQASATPIFRDLAEDIFAGTKQLADLIDSAAIVAERGGAAPVVAEVVAPTAGAPFTIIDGGTF